MARTVAHRPSRLRPDEDIDNLANIPTHGRGGSFIRSARRSCAHRLLNVARQERDDLIHTLATIRSLSDAEDTFGAGETYGDEAMTWATYDREQDDNAEAERAAEEAVLRYDAEESFRRCGDYDCPHCGGTGRV